MRLDIASFLRSGDEEQHWLDEVILSFREKEEYSYSEKCKPQEELGLTYMVTSTASTRGMCGVIADHLLDKRRIAHMHFHGSTLSDDRSKCMICKGNELIKADAFPWNSSNSCTQFIGGHGTGKTIFQGSVAYHGNELADNDLTLCRYSTDIEADCYVHRRYRDSYLLPFGSNGRRELRQRLCSVS